MDFKKKDVMLVLAGIVLLALEFVVRVGSVRLDVFSDIVAYILIVAGISGMTPRSNIFKKCKSTAIKGAVAAVIVQLIYFVDLKEFQANADLFLKGVMTIFFIYFTYYFTEAVALEAKMQDKAAVTRSFRVTWSVFGVLIFAYYIILNFNMTDIVDVIAQAVLIIVTVYYCYTVYGACDRLYMKGLPPHAEQ